MEPMIPVIDVPRHCGSKRRVIALTEKFGSLQISRAGTAWT
ncbi:hypothetical protein ACFOQM_08690 [Paenibacillus sp. GCM10012307]|nr:hypothetical protein [Paenibacillus roseus]